MNLALIFLNEIQPLPNLWSKKSYSYVFLTVHCIDHPYLWWILPPLRNSFEWLVLTHCSEVLQFLASLSVFSANQQGKLDNETQGSVAVQHPKCSEGGLWVSKCRRAHRSRCLTHKHSDKVFVTHNRVKFKFSKLFP